MLCVPWTDQKKTLGTTEQTKTEGIQTMIMNKYVLNQGIFCAEVIPDG